MRRVIHHTSPINGLYAVLSMQAGAEKGCGFYVLGFNLFSLQNFNVKSCSKKKAVPKAGNRSKGQEKHIKKLLTSTCVLVCYYRIGAVRNRRNRAYCGSANRRASACKKYH